MNPFDNTTGQHTVSIMDPRSNKARWVLAAAVAIVVIAVVSIGVLLTQREADNQDSVASVSAAKVMISTVSSAPSTIKVQQGQSIIWENTDGQDRTLALNAADGSGGTSESRIGQGETYSYVFDEPGTFNYYDSKDPTRLNGVVVVE